MASETSGKFLRLDDGSVWTHPERASDLAWTLRYMDRPLSPEQRMALAEICEEYVTLAVDPGHGHKPRLIRRALRATHPTDRSENDGDS